MKLILFPIFIGLGCMIDSLPVVAQQTTPASLATPITVANLDSDAFAQWDSGVESPILDGQRKRLGPESILGTAMPRAQYSGLIFGSSKTPGTRHLRIGFKNPVPVGSVLVHGGGTLSVLKAAAPYPGNLSDDSQWITADRLESDSFGKDEVAASNDALWVLPPGTVTRALRFSHTAYLTDSSYGGNINGAYVLTTRLVNVSPQAIASARSNSQNAGRLSDETHENKGEWDNIAANDSRQKSVAEDPEWVLLTWPSPVTLAGLASLGSGYSAADIQIYAGPADQHPSIAPDDAWKTIKRVTGWTSLYPNILPVHWIDFGGSVTTRAVRMRLTAALNESGLHPHLAGKTVAGTRVWIGELMALATPESASMTAHKAESTSSSESHTLIPIHFVLPEYGFVTLVIEDASGKRIRNLVADAAFPKGENTVYWDGTDDLTRDLDAAEHGVYNIPAEFVAPGRYQVRGLWHRQIDLKYVTSLYSPGEPPWPTQDGSGGWMTNHTPASSAVFIPGSKAPGGQPLIGIGAYISEGGSAFSWVNLEGKKIGGRGWIGGVWTGAQYLAGDSGPQAETNVAAYAASTFAEYQESKPTGKTEIRLTKLTNLQPNGDHPVLLQTLLLDPHLSENGAQASGETDEAKSLEYLSGLAVHNGLMAISEPLFNRLVFIDAKAGKVMGAATVPNPGALAFDDQGRLLLLSGKSLLRYPSGAIAHMPDLPTPETLVQGLEAPQGITLDSAGKIYISDQGNSNQVKVFSPDGRPLSVIGHAGPPSAGAYDPLHMNRPKGLVVDSNGRIWVTEDYTQPKRVSVWNSDGTIWKAYYGPAQYGGGGTLDPEDRGRFLYDGMEFHLDWKTGASTLERVYYRLDDENNLSMAFRCAPPESALHILGKRYLTNAFNSNPTNGHRTAFLFLDRDPAAVPVAAIGSANEWELLKEDSFRAIWPAGIDLKGDRNRNAAMFIWNDLNEDGRVQPDEVRIWAAGSGGVTVAPDGSFVVNDVVSGHGAGQVARFRPVRFTPVGVPVYGPAEFLGPAQGPASSGGNQALAGIDGWTIETNAPPPYSTYGLGGVRNGIPMWSYPSLWPGLGASHYSPAPDRSGELIGTTRLLGGLVTPHNSDAGPIFFINGNMGNAYAMTQDGLFVTQLFQDVRQGPLWVMPTAQPGMLLNQLSLHDENFFPTVTQIQDGSIYMDSGALSALIEIEGLDSIRRLPTTPLRVTAQDLERSAGALAVREAERQKSNGAGVLHVGLQSTPPPMDARSDGWTHCLDWAQIDRRGVSAWFNANNKPYDVQACISITEGKLFALWRTDDPELLRNSGEMGNAPFKTGGALDLMIGTNPHADTHRNQAAVGDLRLLVTQVNHQTKAVLYRAVAPDAPKNQRAVFSAPWHSINFDSVIDVSHQVQLAADGKGNYEIAVPLSVLNLDPQKRIRIKADIGILRGNGTQTTQRVYWNNKATAIVSDVPSEAELTPQLWGIWEFDSETSFGQ